MAVAADREILGDGQIGEEAPALRYQCEAELGAPKRWQARDVPTIDRQFAGLDLHMAHDSENGRCLAGAIGAEERQDLPCLDGE